MPVSLTTSEAQIRHYRRSVAQARNLAAKELNPSGADYQRLFKKQGEFNAGFIALLRQLMADTPDYTLARSILGGDFIAPEEIMTARPGIIYTDEQIAKLADTMPSEEALRWCKANGYAVVAAPPHALSLLNIRALESAFFYSKTGGWYAGANQKFSLDDKTSFGWLMIRKGEMPNSRSSNWTEQSALLSNVECVPNAAEMSWFITTFCKVRGVRLFENVYVRTSSLDSVGDRVFVGIFDAKGLYVSYDLDSGRDDGLGLASARKF